jgi:hypothetical protein
MAGVLPEMPDGLPESVFLRGPVFGVQERAFLASLMSGQRFLGPSGYGRCALRQIGSFKGGRIVEAPR